MSQTFEENGKPGPPCALRPGRVAYHVKDECGIRSSREELSVAPGIVEREFPILGVCNARPVTLDIPDCKWLG
jgi:hypothetical protein